MRALIGLAAGAFLAIVASAGPARAYSVQPMEYVLEPSGPKALQRITVANTRETPLNIEVQAFRVDVDEFGARSFTPADDEFLIFPPQVSIGGDRSQVIQVRYTGEPQVAQGRLYVVRIVQTNAVELVRQDAANPEVVQKLQVAVNFNTTVFVQPARLEPRLEMVQPLSADGSGAWQVRVANKGEGVANLARYEWKLKDASGERVLEQRELDYGETSALPPGGVRLIKVKAANGPGELQFTPLAAPDPRRR